jgi:hypothetical protein
MCRFCPALLLITQSVANVPDYMPRQFHLHRVPGEYPVMLSVVEKLAAHPPKRELGARAREVEVAHLLR